MARRIRDHDWAATPVGPVDAWPPEIRSAVALMLASAFPTVVAWGPELCAIHNDAFQPFLGMKPDALGRPLKQTWQEMWSDIAPLVERALAGQATLVKDLPLLVDRTGASEQRYSTFSYSPIPADDGSVIGLQALITETTDRVRATLTLRESEARYRALVMASSDVVYRVNPDWSELQQLEGRGFISDTMSPRADWMEAYIDRRDWALAREKIAEGIRTKSQFAVEHRVQRVDGSLGWVASQTVPILDAAGEITEWIGTGRDVTERRMTQDRQRVLLELGDILRLAPDPRAAMDGAAELIANHIGVALVQFLAIGDDGDSYEALGGYSDGRLPDSLIRPGRISDHGSEWGPQVRRGEVIFSDDHATRPGTDAVIQERLGLRAGAAIPLIRDGRLRAVFAAAHPEPRQWTEAEKSLLREVAGRTWDMVGRARAEVALAEREARLDAILDTAKDYAIFSTDVEGRVESWSRGAREVFGWTEDEIRGRMMDMAFTPEDRAAGVPERERRIAREQGVAPDVRWHLREDGTRIFIDGVVRPMTGADGQLRGYVKVGQDVTERHAMQERLRENEAMFRSFTDATRDVIWIRDAQDMQFSYVSPAFEQIYGTDLAALMAGDDLQAWAQLIHPDDRAQAVANLHRVAAGSRATHEFRIIRPSDGEERWIRDTDFPIRDAAGETRSIAGIGTDITEMKHAEMAIVASERRFRTLVEGIPQVVWRATSRGEILWASSQSEEFVGRSGPELAGLRWLDLLPEADREVAMAAWDEAAVTGRCEFTCRVHAATGKYRWFQIRAFPLRNDAGEIIEWLGTMTDIQDIHEAPERQAVMMAELQHRTRNLMAVVTAAMEATLRHHPNLAEFAPVFRGRMEAISRVNGLLSRLAEESRITFDELLHAELSAHAAVNGGGAGPQVILDGPKGVRLRSATVQTLALALHELATNAVKYGALSVPEGQLSIRWKRVDGREGPRLRVEWRESGAVMPEPGAAPRGSGYGRTLIEKAWPNFTPALTPSRVPARRWAASASSDGGQA